MWKKNQLCYVMWVPKANVAVCGIKAYAVGTKSKCCGYQKQMLWVPKANVMGIKNKCCEHQK